MFVQRVRVGVAELVQKLRGSLDVREQGLAIKQCYAWPFPPSALSAEFGLRTRSNTQLAAC